MTLQTRDGTASARALVGLARAAAKSLVARRDWALMGREVAAWESWVRRMQAEWHGAQPILGAMLMQVDRWGPPVAEALLAAFPTPAHLGQVLREGTAGGARGRAEALRLAAARAAGGRRDWADRSELSHLATSAAGSGLPLGPCGGAMRAPSALLCDGLQRVLWACEGDGEAPPCLVHAKKATS